MFVVFICLHEAIMFVDFPKLCHMQVHEAKLRSHNPIGLNSHDFMIRSIYVNLNMFM